MSLPLRPLLFLLTLALLLAAPTPGRADNRKMLSINAAKVLAARSLAEMVNGLSLVANETVTDLGAGLPEFQVEGRSAGQIKGVRYEETTYDAEHDIAKVTASTFVDSITTATGTTIALGHQKITRVAFATSTPANAGPLQALRAAELDAYRKLGQEIMGCTLESRTTIANFMLQSDSVKIKTVALLYLAQVKNYSWDNEGNAHVRLTMDVNAASALLGERIVSATGMIEVEGEAIPPPAPPVAVAVAAPPPPPPAAPAAAPETREATGSRPNAPAPPVPLLPLPLPRAVAENTAGIAVIIGNRDYAKAGKDVPDIDYAGRDAEAINQYATTSLGFRPGNIIRLDNATQADLIATFGSESNPHGKLMDWVKPGESEVFVYYSGHGAPSLSSGKGYLLPVDADPAKIELNGYGLDLLYANLAEIKAKSTTVVIDACFSGSSGGGAVIKSASSIALETTASPAPQGATVLTASAGSEIASWDKEQGHGLFTRSFLEGVGGRADRAPIGNSDQRITLEELGRYLRDEVTYHARRLYGREQHPQISGDRTQILVHIGP